VKFEWLPLEAAADFGGADLTVNTLPSTVSKTVEIDLPFSESFVFDVTYDNATDSPATNWQVENRVDGRTMLVFQAVEQLRLFGAFEAAVLYVTEEDVANAMFASIL
jgi:shikimate 5-dehydrogenase